MSISSELQRLVNAKSTLTVKMQNVEIPTNNKLDTIINTELALQNQFSGSLAPTTDIGKDGDVYLQTIAVNPSTGFTMQEKSVTPTKSSQDIKPDYGFDGLSKVICNPIQSAYQDITGVTATKDTVIEGKTFVDAEGNLITGTVKSTETLNTELDGKRALDSQVVSGRTFLDESLKTHTGKLHFRNMAYNNLGTLIFSLSHYDTSAYNKKQQITSPGIYVAKCYMGGYFNYGADTIEFVDSSGNHIDKYGYPHAHSKDVTDGNTTTGGTLVKAGAVASDFGDYGMIHTSFGGSYYNQENSTWLYNIIGDILYRISQEDVDAGLYFHVNRAKRSGNSLVGIYLFQLTKTIL